jgi:hypothetical protein
MNIKIAEMGDARHGINMRQPRSSLSSSPAFVLLLLRATLSAKPPNTHLKEHAD